MSEPTDLSTTEKEALDNLALALVVWLETKTGQGTNDARKAMALIREMPADARLPDNDFDEGFVLGMFCAICELESVRRRKAFVDLATGGQSQ